jgi:hypothetical protein
MISLFTGMRIGEVLALRWGRVDIDARVIAVREALEETKAHGIRFKAPKSKAGRRDVTLPDILTDTLREFRKEQMELRIKLGAGKLPDDALLFAGIGGALPSQKRYSKAWSDFLPDLGFHKRMKEVACEQTLPLDDRVVPSYDGNQAWLVRFGVILSDCGPRLSWRSPENLTSPLPPRIFHFFVVRKQMADDQRIMMQLEREMMWLRTWLDDAKSASDSNKSAADKMGVYVDSLHRITISEAGIIELLLSPGAPDPDSAIASRLAILVKRVYQMQGTIVYPAIER